MKKFLLALGLCLVTSAVSAAPIVTAYLDQNSAAGTFQISLKGVAQDGSGDVHGGVATYSIMLVPNAGTTVLTLDHKSVRAGAAENADGSLSGPVGFTLFRSADGPNNLVVGAGQDTIAPTPFLVYNYGNAAGSFATVQNGPLPLGSNEGNNWTDQPIIVSGTYTPGGWIKINRTDVQTFANVFVSTSGSATTAAELRVVPEPTTIGLAGIGLVGMIAAVRRRKA